MRSLPITRDNIREESRKDEGTRKMKDLSFKKGEKYEAFSICDNCLMSAERIVTQESLQKRMRKQFQTGHPFACENAITSMPCLQKCQQ